MALNHVTSIGLVKAFPSCEVGGGVHLPEDVRGTPLYPEEKVGTHGPRCYRQSSVEAGRWNL